MIKIWILTFEVNNYDQEGAYFLAAFKREPTEEDLKQFGYTHFGRENNEFAWVEKSLENVYQ